MIEEDTLDQESPAAGAPWEMASPSASSTAHHESNLPSAASTTSERQSDMDGVATRMQERATQLMEAQGSLQTAQEALREIQAKTDVLRQQNRKRRRIVLEKTRKCHALELRSMAQQDKAKRIRTKKQSILLRIKEVQTKLATKEREWTTFVEAQYTDHLFSQELYDELVQTTMRAEKQMKENQVRDIYALKRQVELLEAKNAQDKSESIRLAACEQALILQQPQSDEGITKLAERVHEAISKRTKLRQTLSNIK